MQYPDYDATADIEVINNNIKKLVQNAEEQDTQIKSKEPIINKKTGFNLDKTDLTENDSNKLFSAKGALNLFNTLTTNFTDAINTAKEALRIDISKKVNKAGDTITGNLSFSTGAILQADGNLRFKFGGIFDNKYVSEVLTNLETGKCSRNYTAYLNNLTPTDLNNLKEQGLYQINNGVGGITNTPIVYGSLIVSPPGEFMYQIAISEGGLIYNRTSASHGRTWGVWTKTIRETDKTDLVENNTNKVFTSLGALNLKNWLVENYTTLMNNIKSTLETSIATKVPHGGYNKTAQDLKNEVDNKLSLTGGTMSGNIHFTTGASLQADGNLRFKFGGIFDNKYISEVLNTLNDNKMEKGEYLGKGSDLKKLIDNNALAMFKKDGTVAMTGSITTNKGAILQTDGNLLTKWGGKYTNVFLRDILLSLYSREGDGYFNHVSQKDLNTLTGGFYQYNNGAGGVTNNPSTYGSILVSPYGEFMNQIAVTEGGEIHSRASSNRGESWRAWRTQIDSYNSRIIYPTQQPAGVSYSFYAYTGEHLTQGVQCIILGGQTHTIYFPVAFKDQPIVAYSMNSNTGASNTVKMVAIYKDRVVLTNTTSAHVEYLYLIASGRG